MPEVGPDPDDPRSLRTQLTDALRDAYQPGVPLPSTTQLEERFGVSTSTVRAAIRQLREERWVVTVKGRTVLYARTRPGEPDPDARIREVAAELRTSATRTAALAKEFGDLLDNT